MHRELEWPVSKATCLYKKLCMVYSFLYTIIEGTSGSVPSDFDFLMSFVAHVTDTYPTSVFDVAYRPVTTLVDRARLEAPE